MAIARVGGTEKGLVRVEGSWGAFGPSQNPVKCLQNLVLGLHVIRVRISGYCESFNPKHLSPKNKRSLTLQTHKLGPLTATPTRDP